MSHSVVGVYVLKIFCKVPPFIINSTSSNVIIWHPGITRKASLGTTKTTIFMQNIYCTKARRQRRVQLIKKPGLLQNIFLLTPDSISQSNVDYHGIFKNFLYFRRQMPLIKIVASLTYSAQVYNRMKGWHSIRERKISQLWSKWKKCFERFQFAWPF